MKTLPWFSTARFTKTAMLLVAVLTVSACTPEDTSIVTGSLLGAGLGAVIGKQSGHIVEGALIGTVVGGAIGYAVGRARTERVSSAHATAQSQNYRAVEGLQVKQTDAGVTPTAARPGDDVDINATVAIMAPNQQQNVNIRQRIGIYKGDQLIGNIVEDNFTMTPGTHRITRRITLQKDMPAGRYTYVSHIKATAGDDACEASSEAGFTVS